MIVAIGSWLSCNWKLIAMLGGLLGASVTATYNHVEGADSRFDALETQTVRDSASFRSIQQDVSEIKCMVIQNAQDEDPLDCLE